LMAIGGGRLGGIIGAEGDSEDVSNEHQEDVTVTSTPAIEVSTPAPAITIPCNECHTTPEGINAHDEGWRYCQDCHGGDERVHGIHGRLVSNDLISCDSCHTEKTETDEPKVPPKEPGIDVSCASCHSPRPNQLDPSGGNLIVIHISRGYECKLCHKGDLTDLHELAIKG